MKTLERTLFGLLVAIAVLCAVLLVAGPADAQGRPGCMPYNEFTTAATERFGEHRTLAGNMLNGGIIEIWFNKDTGTWTQIARVKQNGSDLACLMAAGEGLFILKPSEGSRASSTPGKPI